MLPSSVNGTVEVAGAPLAVPSPGAAQTPGTRKKSEAAAVFCRKTGRTQGTEAVREGQGSTDKHEGQFKLGLDKWVLHSSF